MQTLPRRYLLSEYHILARHRRQCNIITPVRKIWNLPWPIFTKLANSEQGYVHVCYQELNANRTSDVERTERNSFTSLRKYGCDLPAPFFMTLIVTESLWTSAVPNLGR